MKILILGTNGQVGFALTKANWPPGFLINGVKRPEFDITQPNSLSDILNNMSPDIVINATAYTSVDLAEDNICQAYAVNCDGPNDLAKLCAVREIPFVHFSTDYVFDGKATAPYREDSAVFPINVYGESKEAGESAIRRCLEQHIIIRTSWVHSAHGHNFVKTMKKLGHKSNRHASKPIYVVNDQYGAPTSANDIACVVVCIVDKILYQGCRAWGTYHFSNSGVTTWYELAKEVFNNQSINTGYYPDLHPVLTVDYPTKAQRPLNSCLDCSKIENIFGIRRRSWQDGLEDTLKLLNKG